MIETTMGHMILKTIKGVAKSSLLAILFLGLFLRIYDLGTESIWVDEGISILLANSNLFQIVVNRAQSTHPPMYFIILHYWVNLFGDTEFSTRFLSVIFGLFSILMIYKVGTLLFNKNVGMLSSLLLALSVFHIQYSQEVRMYSLMTLLTLLSIYFFIKLLDRASFTVSTGYIISSILLMYTHIFGLFILIAQNIYLLTLFLSKDFDYKRNFRRWIRFQIILVILYIPWIIVIASQILKLQTHGFWVPVPTMRAIIVTFWDFSGSTLLLLFFLLLSFFSIVTYKKVKGKINWKYFLKTIESYSWNISLSNVNRIYFLVVWLLTPVILPFIISLFSTPIYWTKYTIAASLAFYILIAKGIDNINTKSIKLVVIILVIALSLGNVSDYYSEVNKGQWREVTNYIDINAESGDLILFYKGYCQKNVFDYYSKRTDLNKKPFTVGRDINEENIKELGPTVDGYNKVWLILCHSRDYNKGLIKKTLNESYNLSYHKEYGKKYLDIDLSLFVKEE